MIISQNSNFLSSVRIFSEATEDPTKKETTTYHPLQDPETPRSHPEVAVERLLIRFWMFNDLVHTWQRQRKSSPLLCRDLKQASKSCLKPKHFITRYQHKSLRVSPSPRKVAEGMAPRGAIEVSLATGNIHLAMLNSQMP